MEYLGYFLLVFVLSGLFALGGVGSATALVPIMDMLGLSFGMAKAIGLFVNTSTTIMASVMNIIRKTLDIKFTIPLALSLLIFSPIGAYFSKYVDENVMKFMLAGFLFFSATLMMFGKKEAKTKYQKTYILYILGAIVGIFSGMIGIGGGSLILPILILLGYEAKKMAVVVSFIIPFSTLSAFLVYVNTVSIDWNIILVSGLGALAGGFVGNKIMHFKLNSKQIKKVIAILLYLISIKMFFGLMQ